MLPEAIILGPLVLKATLIVTVLGLLGGVLFVYFTSPFNKDIVKLHVNKLFDVILYFIIFTIVSKVLLNIELFFEDPVAVLAYPSDSKAFYLASITTLIVIGFSLKKQTMDIRSFIDSLFRLIVGSQFIQLFLTLTMTTYHASIYQLALTFLTLILLVFLTKDNLPIGILIGLIALFSVMSFGLSFIGSVPLFGFYVGGFYYLILGLILTVSLLLTKNNSTESR